MMTRGIETLEIPEEYLVDAEKDLLEDIPIDELLDFVRSPAVLPLFYQAFVRQIAERAMSAFDGR